MRAVGSQRSKRCAGTDEVSGRDAVGAHADQRRLRGQAGAEQSFGRGEHRLGQSFNHFWTAGANCSGSRSADDLADLLAGFAADCVTDGAADLTADNVGADIGSSAPLWMDRLVEGH